MKIQIFFLTRLQSPIIHRKNFQNFHQDEIKALPLTVNIILFYLFFLSQQFREFAFLKSHICSSINIAEHCKHYQLSKT